MNKLNMRANWHQAAGKLKQEFAILTNNDVLYKNGKKEELLGEPERKLARDKEEFLKIFENI